MWRDSEKNRAISRFRLLEVADLPTNRRSGVAAVAGVQPGWASVRRLRRQHRHQRQGMTALEQVATLKIVRTEIRVAREHLLAHRGVVDRHQADRLDQAGIVARFTD